MILGPEVGELQGYSYSAGRAFPDGTLIVIFHNSTDYKVYEGNAFTDSALQLKKQYIFPSGISVHDVTILSSGKIVFGVTNTTHAGFYFLDEDTYRMPAELIGAVDFAYDPVRDAYALAVYNQTCIGAYDTSGSQLLNYEASNITTSVEFRFYDGVAYAVFGEGAPSGSQGTLTAISSTGMKKSFDVAWVPKGLTSSIDAYGVSALFIGTDASLKNYVAVTGSTIDWNFHTWSEDDFSSFGNVSFPSILAFSPQSFDDAVAFVIGADADGDGTVEKGGYVYSTASSKGTPQTLVDFSSSESSDVQYGVMIVPTAMFGYPACTHFLMRDSLIAFMFKNYNETGTQYTDYILKWFGIDLQSSFDEFMTLNYPRREMNSTDRFQTELLAFDASDLVLVAEYNSTGYGAPYDTIGYVKCSYGSTCSLPDDVVKFPDGGKYDMKSMWLPSDDLSYSVFFMTRNSDNVTVTLVYRSSAYEALSSSNKFVAVVGNILGPGEFKKMQIMIRAQSDGDIVYQIINAAGKIEEEHVIEGAVKGRVYNLVWKPTEDTSPGLHLLRVSSGGKVGIVKFLVVK